jgi:hypothetical protein
MNKEIIIGVAVIAVGLIVYLMWRPGDDAILNTNAPQLTAPENAPTTKPPGAVPENTQPSQQK